MRSLSRSTSSPSPSSEGSSASRFWTHFSFSSAWPLMNNRSGFTNSMTPPSVQCRSTRATLHLCGGEAYEGDRLAKQRRHLRRPRWRRERERILRQVVDRDRGGDRRTATLVPAHKEVLDDLPRVPGG